MIDDELIDSMNVFPRFMNAVHRGALPERSRDDLNLTQEKLLLILGNHPHAPMSVLAGKINLDRGAFSRVVQSLVCAGMVRRLNDPDDRRTVNLELTAQGQEHIRKLQPILNEHFRKKLSVLSEEQKESLRQALHTLNSIVETLEGDRINE